MKNKKFEGNFVSVFLETDKDNKIRERVYLKDSVNIIFFDGKSVFLIKEKRWENNGEEVVKILSGLIENGEKPEESVQREIKEEIGLEIEKFKLLFEHNQIGTVSQKRYYFVVSIKSGVEQSIKILQKYEKKQLIESIMNGDFGITTSGILIRVIKKLNWET